MRYADTKDMRQNICTWKHKIRLLCMYVCVETYIYTNIYVCVLFFKEQNTLQSPVWKMTHTHTF